MGNQQEEYLLKIKFYLPGGAIYTGTGVYGLYSGSIQAPQKHPF